MLMRALTNRHTQTDQRDRFYYLNANVGGNLKKVRRVMKGGCHKSQLGQNSNVCLATLTAG